MANVMCYCLMLSLKEISLRRVAVLIWNLYKINGNGVEVKVKKHMRKLDLPQKLMEQMLHLVHPIGSEIYNWKFSHQRYLKISRDTLIQHILPNLCWTILGTVDYQKTAEKLIRDEMLDTVELYKLACTYCLIDYIPVLWGKLSEESKSYFYKDDGSLRDRYPQLEFFWPYILIGEENKLDYMFGRRSRNSITFNQHAFVYFARHRNKAATEYFFGKLTNDEREASLLRLVQFIVINQNVQEITYETISVEISSHHSFHYLLSLMGPEQQMDIFKKYPYNVLMIFLDWPWQDLFLEIAELASPFLTAFEYVNILRSISDGIKVGYNYTKLFKDFFQHIPIEFRKHFVDKECLFGCTFHSLFKVEDSEALKLIFKTLDYQYRRRLVFSERIFSRFYNSVLKGKWRLVELCLQEAALIKTDKEILEKVYSRFLSNIEPRNINRRKNVWEIFLNFFDESKAKASSRRNLDEEHLELSLSDCDC